MDLAYYLLCADWAWRKNDELRWAMGSFSRVHSKISTEIENKD